MALFSREMFQRREASKLVSAFKIGHFFEGIFLEERPWVARPKYLSKFSKTVNIIFDVIHLFKKSIIATLRNSSTGTYFLSKSQASVNFQDESENLNVHFLTKQRKCKYLYLKSRSALLRLSNSEKNLSKIFDW